ncbi:MAG TPA: gliding motility protein GldL, partial [Bacteroidetes bacterium]|nr:gliding motility protein GldL [Bacteroidota bacterium]
MSFLKTKKFKYFKNLIIGVGASVVLMGALFKLESWPGASTMLTIGLSVEAFIFLFLGVIGPEPDYYWDKLYPGLSDYHSNIAPLTAGEVDGPAKPLNGEVIENQLGGMLTELQGMSKSLSSLKALQEVDFSGTSEQIKAMNNFYTKLNEAMADLSDSLED